MCEALVDPAVVSRKFEREVENYRRVQDDYVRRGVWLLRAKMPKVFVVFAVPHLRPPAVIFGALIDFQNYDFWAPSVRLVDPFTREPYKFKDLPSQLVRAVPAPIPPEMMERIRAIAGQGVVVQAPQAFVPQPLMQGRPDEIPFFCIPGVREYHEHPAHTGDSLLMHRSRGAGTLLFLLDQLWKYGIQGVASYNCQLAITVAGFIPRTDIQ